MANNVAVSSALRSNLLSLQSTQSLMDQSQLILSTGRKINSALDGAQAFFTAKSLNDRAGDLGRLLDGLGQSISTIQSADQAVSALIKLVDQADAIASQALDELTAASASVTAVGNADLSSVDDIGDDLAAITDGNAFTVTTATANSLEAPTNSKTTTVTIADGDGVSELTTKITDKNGNNDGRLEASQNANGQIEVKSLEEGQYVRLVGTSVTQAGFTALGLGSFVTAENDGEDSTRVAGTLVGGKALTSYASTLSNVTTTNTLQEAGFLSGFTATGDGGTQEKVDFKLSTGTGEDTTIELTDATTISAFVNAVNAGNANVTASFDESTKQIRLTADTDASELTITNTATELDTGTGAAAGGDVAFGFGAAASDGTFNEIGGSGDVASEKITFSGSAADVAQLELDYNEVRNQIDGLVEDASYRGINLLKNDDLTTVFNEDRTNSLVTEGVDFTANGLGISQANFATSTTADSAIDQLREAKNQARDFGSSIANDLAIIQTREDFTKSTINTLETGADKLTLADQNEESARMLALQTRQQIGFVSLSLASQAAQGVLRLF